MMMINMFCTVYRSTDYRRKRVASRRETRGIDRRRRREQLANVCCHLANDCELHLSRRTPGVITTLSF